MANRFWVGDGGNWSDNTNHWSASSGGAPNASLPTSADSVYYDANSFTIPGQTVTVDATAFCLDMDWTGATNTPTLAGSGASDIYAYGSVTFITNMVTTTPRNLYLYGPGTLTTNGLTLNLAVGLQVNNAASNVALADTLTVVGKINARKGTFNTNGQVVTCTTFGDSADASAKTLTLGSSVINCTSWSFPAGNLTVTANTATINCSGGFAGGDIATYNIVNLTGATSTIKGSSTFATLALPSGTTQTITFTTSSVQTTTTATLSGDATHQHNIQSSVAGTLASLIATNVTDDYVTYTDMRLSWETLTVGEILTYGRILTLAETENIRLATKWRYQ